MGEVGQAANPWVEGERANERSSLQPPMPKRACETANPPPLIRGGSGVLREVDRVLVEEPEPAGESIVYPLRLSLTHVIAQEVPHTFDDGHRASLCSPDPPFDILTHWESFIEHGCDAPFESHLPNVRDRSLKETSADFSLCLGTPRDVRGLVERCSPTDGDRCLGQAVERDLEPIAREEIIIVEERHECAARGSQPGIPGGSGPHGALVSDDLDPWIDRSYRVRMTVLNDDALEIRNGLAEHRIDGLTKKLWPAARGHDDAEQGAGLRTAFACGR
jgi:hypothetical protein